MQHFLSISSLASSFLVSDENDMSLLSGWAPSGIPAHSSLRVTKYYHRCIRNTIAAGEMYCIHVDRAWIMFRSIGRQSAWVRFTAGFHFFISSRTIFQKNTAYYQKTFLSRNDLRPHYGWNSIFDYKP
jgi:hypothetical protein